MYQSKTTIKKVYVRLKFPTYSKYALCVTLSDEFDISYIRIFILFYLN